VQLADNVSWPIEMWEKEAVRDKSPRPKDAPIVRIEVAFIAGKPDRLRELGLPFDQPARVVSAQERSKILAEALSDARTRKLFVQRTMKVAALSGRRAYFVIKTGYQYEGEPTPAAQATDYLANLMTVNDGIALTIEACVEGSDVVFTQIDPRVVAVLGLRTCTAKTLADGKEAELSWQEPAVLLATGRVGAPARIQVGPGESVFVPLHHSVLLGSGKARAEVPSGAVRVEYDQGTRVLRHPDPRGYPLRNQVFVLLTPKIAEPK
jgi:hypothetical protein